MAIIYDVGTTGWCCFLWSFGRGTNCPPFRMQFEWITFGSIGLRWKHVFFEILVNIRKFSKIEKKSRLKLKDRAVAAIQLRRKTWNKQKLGKAAVVSIAPWMWMKLRILKMYKQEYDALKKTFRQLLGNCWTSRFAKTGNDFYPTVFFNVFLRVSYFFFLLMIIHSWYKYQQEYDALKKTFRKS